MNSHVLSIEEFVSNFAAQFDETDASAFSPSTSFKDIEEWSSMVALSIIAMVDEHYSVKIKGDDIRAAVTIQDLFEIVQSKS